MAGLRAALTAEDVFERLESVKHFIKARRQIDLSRKDIELLLEYRNRMEIFKEEFFKRTNEMDDIKRVLRLCGDATDDNLQKLTKVPVSAGWSDTVTQIHQISLLLSILKLALKDTFAKIKNGARIPVPRDSDSTPTFYNIVRENIQKKDFTLDKELLRATRLWLWTKSQSGKPCKKNPAPAPRDSQPAREPGDATATPIPATPKTPFRSTGPAYQCHLLLNKHPASSAITAPDFTTATSLEHKLSYLLDELERMKKKVAVPQAMKVTNIKPSNQVQKEPVCEKAEIPPVSSAIKMASKHSQTSPELGKGDSSQSAEADEAFLKQSTSSQVQKAAIDNMQKDSQICNLCKRPSSKMSHRHSFSDTEQLSKLMEEGEVEPSSFGSSFARGRRRSNSCRSDGQLSAISLSQEDEPLDAESVRVGEQSLTSSEIADKASIERLYENLVTDNNNNNTSSGSRVLRRRSSSLAMRCSTSTDVYQETSVIALPPSLNIHANDQKVMVETYSRAVSAISCGFTPAKQPTIRMKDIAIQTEEPPKDPQNMLPSDLFKSEDFADVPFQESYSDYRPNNIGYYSPADPGRLLFSPDSEVTMINMISCKLNPDQWKTLYKMLISKSEKIIPNAVINEDIEHIVEHHHGDKMQATASLEKWRQTNGEFLTDILLHCLAEIRRNDIVNAIKKHLARQHRIC